MLHAQSLHLLAEACLYQAATVDDKLNLIDTLARHQAEGTLDFKRSGVVQTAEAVVLPERPKLVDPRQLASRNFNTEAGQIAFFHAIAHIEFTAILLALDMAYRFEGMPLAFYHDWLGVAVEEALHFRLLRERLAGLNADYGDLPAHRGLWTTAEETAHDVLARLALVPRCMEARGLDVTPGMIAKLKHSGATADVALLERIYHDEIGHVSLGTRWFGYVCEQRKLDVESTYFHLLGEYLHGDLRGPFNLEARRQAGFGENELTRLANL